MVRPLRSIARQARMLWVEAPLAMLAVPAVTMSVLAYTGRLGSGRVHYLALWFTALLVGIVLLGLAGLAPHRQAETFRRSGILATDRLTGVEFETRLKSLFEHQGFSVDTTATSGDFGADLVLLRDGERTVVQAKRYSGSVGLSSVQEAVAALAHSGATSAIVVTNSWFTKAAKQLAASNGVQLVERSELTAMLATQGGDVGVVTGWRLLVEQVTYGIVPLLRIAWRLVCVGVTILRVIMRGLVAWR
jgi:restriction system protein